MYVIVIMLIIITAILFANYLYNYLLIIPQPKIIDKNPYGYCNITKPFIKPFELKNIITERESNDLINYCLDNKTDNGKTTGIYVNNTNDLVCWIPKTNPIIKPLIDKMAKMFKTPFEHAENVRITRYFPNQSFKDRYDSCCDDNAKCRNFMKSGGHRIISILVYLTDDYIGGETYFHNIGLKFKPKKGDGIVFYPIDPESNKCHPALAYSGLPIESGIKWTINVWFRDDKII